MRLTFNFLNDSALNILRRAGYSFLKQGREAGEKSFVKRIGHADFPRFHIFLKEKLDGRIEINLHLDQKAASYSGSISHSGEYENEGWLAKEAEFLRREFAKHVKDN